jgi:membrane protease YdiL (CAAX protease family)
MTFLDYAARGKNSFWRYLIAWPLGFIIAMVLAVALLVPPVILHWLPIAFIYDMQSPAHAVPFFVGSMMVSFGVICLGSVIAIYLLHHKSPVDIVGAWSWPRFLAGVVLWLAFLAVATGFDVLLQPGAFHLAGTLTPAIVAVAIPGIALQTFTEEFIFRGYLTQGLLLWLKKPWLASILSGLVFGAMHIPNGTPQAIGAVVFGIVMSMIAIRSGGLAMGYGIHLINNLFAGLVVVSDDDVFHGLPAIWIQHAPNLLWSDTALELVGLLALLWLALGTRWLIPANQPALTPADKYPK